VGPDHDAHRIDLEELGRRDDAREPPGVDLLAFAIEALGSERAGARFVQG
jgi:hypothetical protein